MEDRATVPEMWHGGAMPPPSPARLIFYLNPFERFCSGTPGALSGDF